MMAARIISSLGMAWLAIFLGLATAMPKTWVYHSRANAMYPAMSTSTGFTLIANVTDLSHDLSPSVNNIAVTPLHVGAGLNLAVLNTTTTTTASYAPPIFYLNGTNPSSNILTDAGTSPVYPEGLTATPSKDPPLADVFLNLGSGSPMTLSDPPAVFVVNQPPPPSSSSGTSPRGTFVACDTFVAYYGSNFITLRWIAAVPSADGTTLVTTVPAGCAPVRLLPQCAVLADLPDGSWASHQFAQTVHCYEDVAAIDWSRSTG